MAKLTFYVVYWTPDKMSPLREGISRAAAKLGITPAPPTTLIGVAALDVPDHLVEIEATAILDRTDGMPSLSAKVANQLSRTREPSRSQH